MTLHLRHHSIEMALYTPFVIARGRSLQARNEVVELYDDQSGLTGLGLSAPAAFYGETTQTVGIMLERFAGMLGDDPDHIEHIMTHIDESVHYNQSAKAAVDIALHDLLGKKLNAPLYKILGLDPERTCRTSFTIALDTPEAMAERARAAAERYPILKIKIGTPNDEPRLRAIREAVPTDTIIRVDANTGWTAKEAIQHLNRLAEYGIEYVEQPVRAEDLEGLAEVTRNVPMPVIADESCVTLMDIQRIVGKCDGINIKLAKCGGLSNALKMIHTARAFGLRVMVGCMVESTIGTTAMAHLTPLVDYADLDGHLLISDDPYTGVAVEQGKLILPDAPGIGVQPRA